MCVASVVYDNGYRGVRQCGLERTDLVITLLFLGEVGMG